MIQVSTSTAWADQFIIRTAQGRIDRFATHDVLPRSDMRSAQAIVERFPDWLSYGTQSGQWRIWNGQVHEEANGADVEKLVGTYAEVINRAMNYVKADYEAEAAAAPDDKAREKIMKEYREIWQKHRQFRDRLFSQAGQQAVVGMLRTIVGIDEAEFDQTPQFMVMENGVVDLDMVQRTGRVELLDHDPKRKVTVRTPVLWQPGAKATWWSWYLERSLPDPEVRGFLQRWVGSALLGNQKNKGLVNLIGPQDSGKSVFVDTMIELFGDYGDIVRTAVFLAKRPGDQGYDLHELRGLRFVGAVEPGSGKFLDDETVKMLTGGDKTKSREPYGKFVRWTPQCTIFIASNQAMRFDTSDGALLNRIKPIRFPKRFLRYTHEPDGTPVPDELRAELKLQEYLKHEMPGIMQWAFAGLMDYIANGIGNEPGSVSIEREEMAEDIDSPLQWASEAFQHGKIVVAPKDAITSHCLPLADAYNDYRVWAALNGDSHPYGRNKFSAVIQRRYGPVAKSGARVFTGLGKGQNWR